MRQATSLLVLAVAVFTGCSGSTSSPAAHVVTPSPTLGITPVQTPFAALTQPPDVLPFVDFGFRVVLSGPASARAGEEIAYTLEYQRVGPTPRGSDTGIVVRYDAAPPTVPPKPVASLVGIQAVVGPPPTDGVPQVPGYAENLAFGADSGTLRITLRVMRDFTGTLDVELYIRGTSIEFSPGSVNEVTTQISAS